MTPHGTVSRYKHQKCRCDLCRAAVSAHGKALRVYVPRRDPVHGTTHCYNFYHCRCEECVQASRNWLQSYRASRPGADAARQRARYAANPEKTAERRRTPKGQILNRKVTSPRRARKRAVFVEEVDPSVIFERDLGVCQICDSWVLASEKWHVDHRVPLSKGGEHSYANCQLSHGACNQSKGSKLL